MTSVKLQLHLKCNANLGLGKTLNQKSMNTNAHDPPLLFPFISYLKSNVFLTHDSI